MVGNLNFILNKNNNNIKMKIYKFITLKFLKF